MMHRYTEVMHYTRTQIVDMADCGGVGEFAHAAVADAQEPHAVRAWRGILRGHSNIRGHIHDIRKALFDMGAGMSPRGYRYINNIRASGWRWNDPRPDLSLLKAQKCLANAIAEMPKLWKNLYKIEQREVRDI